MIKLAIAIMLACFPVLVAADSSSLSFAPPAGDYSVIFLGNMFGVVDGVLTGTGSQMLGSMFAVFNAAMLSLGGIIIIYTLMVSTLNTAHQGKMMGEKWSSIWVPIRSTLGLALLLPKASGYCTMQIFVMWITVQGVGAADKVWEAALSYLNRGGVIIQAQATNPTEALTSSTSQGIAQGASIILSGQLCMLGLQKQLEAQRQYLLDQGDNGPCSGGAVKELCENSVPDFLGSVNAYAVQSLAPELLSYSVPMPNFDAEDYPSYHFLNGICGTLTWYPLSVSLQQGVQDKTGTTPTLPPEYEGGNPTGLTSTEIQTTRMSRVIAIQQMYVDLASVAQVMVTNDPQIGTRNSGSNTNQFSPMAIQQFGVPYTENNEVCEKYDNNCTTWGIAASTAAAGVLFNGTEFQGAITNYNTIMMPTLNLINSVKQALVSNDSRAFISNANSQGWIMAGAYFFDLIKLNGNAVDNSNQTDKNTGLEKSIIQPDDVGQACAANSSFGKLCEWFNKDPAKLLAVESLNDGITIGQIVPAPAASNALASRTATKDIQSSTGYGFINNSLMIRLPGQPGATSLDFAKKMTFTVDTAATKLYPQKFDCGGVTIVVFKFCLGWMMGNLFYNVIFLFIYNTLMTVFELIISQVITAFLMIPLVGMSEIFKEGVATISEPGVNPIVALANMGVMYINFSGNLWLMLLGISVTTSLIPFGMFIYAIFALALPLILAWVGIMTSVGFITAYYIPLLPYLMFTFGAIAWLICVIEAMVAAPIVALGVTHPEGHEAFGKGEHAIMILLNVFLRPSMMIIGYVAAIALSYVGVWILNAGFGHAVSYYQGGPGQTSAGGGASWSPVWDGTQEQGSGSGETRYTDEAGIYAFFFAILAYTSAYLVIVQQAFTLIGALPDKVLRWIGVQPEQLGQDASRWGEEMKGGMKGAGEESSKGQGQIGKQLGGRAEQGVGAAKQGADKMLGGGGEASASGGGSTGKAEAGKTMTE